MSKPAVLVTGGAGFIGSVLVHELQKKGIPGIVVDKNSTGAAPFEKLDLTDPRGLTEILKKHQIEAVVHLAALIKVEESVRHPELYLQSNLTATQKLLESMKAAGVRKFLFASTAAVYGNVSVPLVDENLPTRPMNPYGESKLKAEQAIQEFGNSQADFSYLIFRFFNVAGSVPEFTVGPTEPAPTQLIRRACQALVGTGPALQVFGSDYPTPDGSCIRDYIHIKDLVLAMLRGLDLLEKTTAEKNFRDILNIGYGRGFSVLEVIKELEKISGQTVPHQIQGRRPGDPAAVVANSQKAQRVLDLKWQHESLEEICKDSLSWEKHLARLKNGAHP